MLVLPDVNYDNSLDDSYCTEMQKTALLMYAIYPFKCANLHNSVTQLHKFAQFMTNLHKV